jgi:aryl-phospho-beta-D-glucosidase BglC (GH1 family)
VDTAGNEIRLRGTCVGGWMNMENFINGYPGTESGIRSACIRQLGSERGEFLFDRWLEHFFTEQDVVFLKGCGVNVIRIPLNYRHFESDDRPFEYRESGFARLDNAIAWCARHEVYVILDLHAVAGCQNPDWHCDNVTYHSFFWTHKQFQDRFVGLWEALAQRYRDNATVAGYNVMNEPVTGRREHGSPYRPFVADWDVLNRVYARVIAAIRAIDTRHIIFVEGDEYSNRFSGLELPRDANTAVSSHNYMTPGIGHGPYPGDIGGSHWDREAIADAFEKTEGLQYARANNVPLWVGEFGSVYNGPAELLPDRLRALDDEISVFEQHQAHWTTWTYKDVGVMGWVMVAGDSEYMRTIKPVFRAKMMLHADSWGWMPATPATVPIEDMAQVIDGFAPDARLDKSAHIPHLRRVVFVNYVGSLLQDPFARCFKDKTESEIDRVFRSFRLENCTVNQGLVDVVRKHTRA